MTLQNPEVRLDLYAWQGLWPGTKTPSYLKSKFKKAYRIAAVRAASRDRTCEMPCATMSKSARALKLPVLRVSGTLLRYSIEFLGNSPTLSLRSTLIGERDMRALDRAESRTRRMMGDLDHRRRHRACCSRRMCLPNRTSLMWRTGQSKRSRMCIGPAASSAPAWSPRCSRSKW